MHLMGCQELNGLTTHFYHFGNGFCICQILNITLIFKIIRHDKNNPYYNCSHSRNDLYW